MVYFSYQILTTDTIILIIVHVPSPTFTIVDRIIVRIVIRAIICLGVTSAFIYLVLFSILVIIQLSRLVMGVIRGISSRCIVYSKAMTLILRSRVFTITAGPKLAILIVLMAESARKGFSHAACDDG